MFTQTTNQWYCWFTATHVLLPRASVLHTRRFLSGFFFCAGYCSKLVGQLSKRNVFGTCGHPWKNSSCLLSPVSVWQNSGEKEMSSMATYPPLALLKATSNTTWKVAQIQTSTINRCVVSGPRAGPIHHESSVNCDAVNLVTYWDELAAAEDVVSRQWHQCSVGLIQEHGCLVSRPSFYGKALCNSWLHRAQDLTQLVVLRKLFSTAASAKAAAVKAAAARLWEVFLAKSTKNKTEKEEKWKSTEEWVYIFVCFWPAAHISKKTTKIQREGQMHLWHHKSFSEQQEKTQVSLNTWFSSVEVESVWQWNFMHCETKAPIQQILQEPYKNCCQEIQQDSQQFQQDRSPTKNGQSPQ